jgi:hypothetical protein
MFFPYLTVDDFHLVWEEYCEDGEVGRGVSVRLYPLTRAQGFRDPIRPHRSFTTIKVDRFALEIKCGFLQKRASLQVKIVWSVDREISVAFRV